MSNCGARISRMISGPEGHATFKLTRIADFAFDISPGIRRPAYQLPVLEKHAACQRQTAATGLKSAI